MHTTCFGHSWGGFAKNGRFSCTTASCERGCMTHGGGRTGVMLQFLFPQCFASWRQTCFKNLFVAVGTYMFHDMSLWLLYIYILYINTWNMYVPTTNHSGQVQSRHFREMRKYSSNQMIIMRIKGCPRMPLPQKLNKALIGPYKVIVVVNHPWRS